MENEQHFKIDQVKRNLYYEPTKGVGERLMNLLINSATTAKYLALEVTAANYDLIKYYNKYFQFESIPGKDPREMIKQYVL